jgi:CxxC-x17-CxxC domain-containing protein
MYQFTCPRCGNPGEVPFEPTNPDNVLCKDCHEETGGKTYDLSKATKAPRRKHNTRVTLNIVCAECGVEAELDYVPKGVSISEMKCKSCMAKSQDDDSQWKLIEELKSREQKSGRPTYEIECSACGKSTDLPFKPDPNKTYFCKSCYENDGKPVVPNRSSEPRQSLGQNVFIRPKSDK